MKLNTFLTIHGIIYLVFGLGLLLLPTVLLGLYGFTSLDATGILLARLQAPFLLGIGLTAVLARTMVNREAGTQAILVGLVVANGLSAIITLIASLTELFNVLGWSDPILFIVLAIGCGYYLAGPSSGPEPSLA